MGRVLLLTTGRLEHQALGNSLRRVFPGHRFETTSEPFHSFTSAPVRTDILQDARAHDANVMKVAGRLVAEVAPGSRRRGRYDAVLAVEDLELANLDRPGEVIALVREAVRIHLERHPWPAERSRHRANEAVRTRCSFHLFSPMVEAYFFGSPDALTRAGAKRAAILEPSRDLEEFGVTDPDYLAALTNERDARHPKRYLEWLCRPDSYKETKGGVAALRELDWRTVFSPVEQVQFARSLFHDLAEALGEETPFPGRTHPLTLRSDPDRVLRNI